MRVLIVGAGAIGGYFGARLLQAGRDVTFLLRPARAAQFSEAGLRVISPAGDVHLPNPKHVSKEQLAAEQPQAKPYDLILLSCKSYDLAAAMEAFGPAVGPQTSILPLLNGMAHIDQLVARFPEATVLGGLCVISVDLNANGEIVHLNDTKQLTFGALDSQPSKALEAVTAALTDAGFDAVNSASILQDMWEKWVFIATLAGITCLLRSSIGDIHAAGGGALTLALLDECAAIAANAGHPVRAAAHTKFAAMLAGVHSPLTASMLRDVERGAATEVEHLLGNLLARRATSPADSLLSLACVHLRAYEVRRRREQ